MRASAFTMSELAFPSAQPANTAAVPMATPTELPSPLSQPTIQNPALAMPLPNAEPVEQPDSEPDLETYHLTLATHAEHNPAFIVQPVRKIKKLSDAQKASNLLRQKVEQEKHKQLIEAFEALLQRHAQEQEELAKKFCIKPEYLDKLKGTSKHFKVKRSMNIENAKIHKKAIEINGGTVL